MNEKILLAIGLIAGIVKGYENAVLKRAMERYKELFGYACIIILVENALLLGWLICWLFWK